MLSNDIVKSAETAIINFDATSTAGAAKQVEVSVDDFLAFETGPTDHSPTAERLSLSYANFLRMLDAADVIKIGFDKVVFGVDLHNDYVKLSWCDDDAMRGYLIVSKLDIEENSFIEGGTLTVSDEDGDEELISFAFNLNAAKLLSLIN